MTRTDGSNSLAVGRVARIWRYPVKSMRGEPVSWSDVDERGLVGDRHFAVRDPDGRFGSGKNTNRFRLMAGLLDFQARYVGEPGAEFVAELACPGGARHLVGTAQADDAVRAHLGRDDVRLAAEDAISHFDDGPIHLLSTASLDWMTQAIPEVPFDDRRLRPNLVLDTAGGPFTEDEWVGRRLRFVGAEPGGADPHGEADPAADQASDHGPVIEVCSRTARCVMINAAQDDLPHSSLPLKALAGREVSLGVWARVLRPGTVHVGDRLVEC